MRLGGAKVNMTSPVDGSTGDNKKLSWYLLRFSVILVIKGAIRCSVFDLLCLIVMATAGVWVTRAERENVF